MKKNPQRQIKMVDGVVDSGASLYVEAEGATSQPPGVRQPEGTSRRHSIASINVVNKDGPVATVAGKQQPGPEQSL